MSLIFLIFVKVGTMFIDNFQETWYLTIYKKVQVKWLQNIVYVMFVTKIVRKCVYVSTSFVMSGKFSIFDLIVLKYYLVSCNVVDGLYRKISIIMCFEHKILFMNWNHTVLLIILLFYMTKCGCVLSVWVKVFIIITIMPIHMYL